MVGLKINLGGNTNRLDIGYRPGLCEAQIYCGNYFRCVVFLQEVLLPRIGVEKADFSTNS